MRRTLLLLLALVVFAVGAVGVVGSAAWFTDQSTVPVSATGAELDIRAEVGPPGEAQNWYDPTGVTLNIAKLAPGAIDEDQKYMISVQNKPAVDSDLAVKYRYTSKKVSSTSGFWANLYVQVEAGPCVSNDLGNPIQIIYDGLLKDLSFVNDDNTWYTETNSAGDKVLPVNFTHCYRFGFYLDELAGNELQDGAATFDIVIDATQPENPGWAQNGT